MSQGSAKDRWAILERSLDCPNLSLRTAEFDDPVAVQGCLGYIPGVYLPVTPTGKLQRKVPDYPVKKMFVPGRI